MAGAGFKTFGVGDVLTASDVNTYLMQQAVMNFADSGARGSAIGTATEGMVSYLQDTDAVEVYDGSAWTAVGSDPGVLQVVSTTKTDTFSTTSTSFTDVTGLTVSITPSSATNKVLLVAQVSLGSSANGVNLRLSGGNAGTYIGDAASNRIRSVIGGSSLMAGDAIESMVLVFLDSPATTSSTTYAVEMRTSGSAGYVNRSTSDVNLADYSRGASSITAIEVAA